MDKRFENTGVRRFLLVGNDCLFEIHGNRQEAVLCLDFFAVCPLVFRKGTGGSISRISAVDVWNKGI